MQIPQILQTEYLGNPLSAWAVAAGAAALAFVALRVLKAIVLNRLRALAARVRTDAADVAIDLVRRTRLFFLGILALYFGSRFLTLPDSIQGLLRSVTVVLFFLQLGLWGNGVIAFYVERVTKGKMQEDPATATTLSALRFIGKLLLWAAILLLVLDNVGVAITPLLTGLGVGGIAVALAVQSILGDLFASLTIVLDKPFVIGDFIIVGEQLGTVEHIGLKTTRVRSLWGEQLIFANSDLLSSRIRNFKRMYERRVVFKLGVVYGTPHETLERIPGMTREIVEAQPLARFDRAHFQAFGDSSLDFEIVYWVKDPDYTRYMDTQQAIHLAIYKRFAQEGIEFAYPTRTLYIHTAQPGAGEVRVRESHAE